MLADIIQNEKKNGRKPVFVRIPALVDIENDVPRKVFDFNNFMQEKGVDYMQLYDSVSVMKPEVYRQLYIPDDGHPTTEGAELFSGYILPLIE